MKERIIAIILGVIALPFVCHFSAVMYLKIEGSIINKAYAVRDASLNRVGLQFTYADATIDAMLDEAAAKRGVPRAMAHAVAVTESAKNPQALSPKSAIGVMQIHYTNVERCGVDGVDRLWDRRTNIDCGMKILKEELDKYNGDKTKALQAYNGGPKCVGKCGESITYAKNVLSRMGELL